MISLNLKRPECVRCKVREAFVSFSGYLICLNCFDELKKKKDAQNKAWIEE